MSSKLTRRLESRESLPIQSDGARDCRQTCLYWCVSGSVAKANSCANGEHGPDCGWDARCCRRRMVWSALNHAVLVRFRRGRSAAFARSCGVGICTTVSRSRISSSTGRAHSDASRRPASRGGMSSTSPDRARERSTPLSISANFLVSLTFTITGQNGSAPVFRFLSPTGRSCT